MAAKGHGGEVRQSLRGWSKRAGAALGRLLPERRLFIRSEDHTRFVRLGPGTQLALWSGLTVFVAGTGLVSVIVLIDSVGGSNVRAQAERDLYVYEDRVEALTAERDRRIEEVAASDQQFEAVLEQISLLQGQLLDEETRRLELEQTFAAVQGTLRRAVDERDAAQAELVAMGADTASDVDLAPVVALVTAALAQTAAERDEAAAARAEASSRAVDFDLELRLMAEQTEDAFGQIEDALALSTEPLDEAFRSAGLDPQDLVGAASSDHASPEMALSTSGTSRGDDSSVRANRILDRLDEIGHYAEAMESVPLAMPVQAAFRFTSPFGPRWGRMHEGVDMAGPVGTPVYATADGEVTFAGWQNGYGRIVIVRHPYGLETRYPHLNAIRAEVGQRVSRGDQVGDMGNSGRSTGPHLHYEIRVNGEAVNPMTFIRAGQEIL